MCINSKLKDISKDLSLSYYKLDGFVFNIAKNQTTGMAMKSLIQITTRLEEENIKYSIDHEYNIHIKKEES